MPTVQEILTQLHRTAPDAADAQLDALADAIRELDTMLVAFFPPTKHYLMVKEMGQPTAVIFSNRASFELFAERCKEQGIYTAAIENPKDQRQLLFTDLWRCGFTRVIVDFAPEFANLHIGDLYPMPDLRSLPLAERPVLHPPLTAKILYLFQQIHSNKADGHMELDALRELYHAPLFAPAEVFQVEGRTAMHIPTTERDGKKCVCLFTDHREMANASLPAGTRLAIVRFAEMRELMQQGADLLIINDGSGAELAIDEKLLDIAEQAAMGELEGITIHTMQERGEKLTVTDPEEVPDELDSALRAVLQNHPEVTSAYLRVVKQENTLRPRWLLLTERTEDRGEKALFRELAESAQPYLGNRDIEFSSYEKARELAGNAKPFYKKKRFGLFR